MVTKQQSPAPTESTTPPIGWMTVLGLNEPPKFDWHRVRGAQLNLVHRLVPARLVVSLLGMVCVVLAMAGTAPVLYLYGWALGCGILIALAGYTTL